MTAFDAHAHVIVPELLRDAEPSEAWRPTVRRVLLGSDYRFDMADPDPVATVRAAGLDDAAQAAVLHGNAERELWRVAVAGGPRG